MSVATTFPYTKIPNPSSSSSSSTSSCFRFSKPCTVTIRSSQAEGPIRRPVAPSPPLKAVPPSPVSAPKPAAQTPAVVGGKSVVTLEFQRQKAKELQEYFKEKKLEESSQGPFFGFIAKNEISNGRWAMFGFAVGMLTEYATGSDFVDQVKILLTDQVKILLANFGILHLKYTLVSDSTEKISRGIG